MSEDLERLLREIRACRVCADAPIGRTLPHEPRPVVRAKATARLAVCGQAPGTRVHASGMPFTDPSGVRLRHWMGVSEAEFYDERRIAIVPMGFCFPGHDRNGGDLPPRRECAPLWRARVMHALPRVELILLVGRYALDWHLPSHKGRPMSDIVAGWREILHAPGVPNLVPLPHPSWRNNTWLKKNPWFERELLPEMQQRVRAILGPVGPNESLDTQKAPAVAGGSPNQPNGALTPTSGGSGGSGGAAGRRSPGDGAASRKTPGGGGSAGGAR